MVQRFALKIAYLGQNYFGFQRQKGDIPTIEGTILDVLQQLEIINSFSAARYSAAGRTDRGVNALGQVIAFDSLRDKIYLEEINQYLPDDIYAWAISPVHSDFNARYDATKRTYHYFYPYGIEFFDILSKTIGTLEGTHDFQKFAKKSDPLPSGKKKKTVLTLEKATVKQLSSQQLLCFEFVSQSFLWKQVRKMVSLLIDIGKGIYDASIISKAFDPSDPEPHCGIKPAPAVGLLLYKVVYPNIPFKTIDKKEMVTKYFQEKRFHHKALLSILENLEEVIITK
jgi:tRNA pseudouridine38-40 synthase